MIIYFRVILILILAILSLAFVIEGFVWVGLPLLAIALLLTRQEFNQEKRLRTEMHNAYKRGEAYFDQDEHEQAIEQFSSVLEKEKSRVWIFGDFPHLAETYAYRRQAHQSLGDDVRANEDHVQGIRLTPDISEQYIQRGKRYEKEGNYQQAIEQYNHAIKLEPGSLDAYDARANARFQMGDYAGTIQDCTHVIETNPAYLARSYSLRGCSFLYQGDAPRALEDFTTNVVLESSAGGYWTLSVAQHTLEMHESRISSLEKALELDENFVEAYYCRGNLREYLGDSSGGMEDFQRAFELEARKKRTLADDDVHALYERGFARHHMGDHAGAIADLHQAKHACQRLKYYTFLEKVMGAIDDVST